MERCILPEAPPCETGTRAGWPGGFCQRLLSGAGASGAGSPDRAARAAAALRADLQVAENVVYFNHAARGPVPGRVVEAVRLGLVADSNGELRGAGWKTFVAETRERAARFLGASAREVAFVQNTSTGLSLAAAAVRWLPGDNVVVSLAENPANLTPWLHLAEFGVETRCAPTRDACADVDALLALADARTRVLAVGAVEYTSGQRLPLARIGAFCRERGILFVVDAAQALGAVPLDVRKSGADILACGASKWLMAPMGIGLLFVDERVMGGLRTPLVGEHAIHPETDYSRHPELLMRPGAMRFEAGAPNLAGINGLAEALTVLEEVGMDAVASRVKQLTDRLAAGLAHAGWRVISPRQGEAWSGIVSFDPTPCRAEAVGRTLAGRNVYVAARRGYVRVSPHWYNTEDEIDQLLEELRKGPLAR